MRSNRGLQEYLHLISVTLFLEERGRLVSLGDCRTSCECFTVSTVDDIVDEVFTEDRLADAVYLRCIINEEVEFHETVTHHSVE
jgi:hypothetical protein